MRIAVVGLRGVPNVIGGVETHCERLYPDLAAASPSDEFWLLTRRRFTAPSTQALGLAKVRALWAPRSTALEAAVHTALAILHAKIGLEADVVHIHSIGPAFFSPMVRALGMRAVVTHHAVDYVRPKWGRFAQGFLRVGERLAARFADQIICVSEALRLEFLARHPEAAVRTTTITHGYAALASDADHETDVLERLGLKPGGYVVAVGRLDETKRFHDLIAAMSRVGQTALPLVIVGSSVDGNVYADTLRRSTGAKIIFAGDRYGQDLACLYKNAALLIHPSEMEGFGLVVLEALMLGTSVFVSDIPAHREFGLPEAAYFPVGDIEAVRRALESPHTLSLPREVISALKDAYRPADAVAAHARVFDGLRPAGEAWSPEAQGVV